jgi:hypothetical protein
MKGGKPFFLPSGGFLYPLNNLLNRKKRSLYDCTLKLISKERFGATKNINLRMIIECETLIGNIVVNSKPVSERRTIFYRFFKSITNFIGKKFLN